MSDEERVDPQEGEFELLRRASGEALPAAAEKELDRRLAAEPGLRAELEETRELLEGLRAALGPAPLRPGVLERIERRLRLAGEASRKRRGRVMRICGFAAAAVVVLAVAGWLAWRPAEQAGDVLVAEGAGVELSEDEVDVIVAAWRLMDWEGGFSENVASFATELSDLGATVESVTAGGTGLPWGADDDWDMPQSEEGVGHIWPHAADLM